MAVTPFPKHLTTNIHSTFQIQPMHPLFIILLFCVLNTIIISVIPGPAYTGNENETDYHALLTIKSKITQDPLGVLHSWNDSAHFCTWKGVECGPNHKRVTTLDLSSYGLVGSLSPFVGNLTFLRDLYLYNNTFTGQVPPEVGCLFSLERLDLANNIFQGEIPTNISGCLGLVSLQLDDNKLVGELPFGLSFLSRLIFLGLGGNALTGDSLLPLANLTSLQILALNDQDRPGFHGNIPDFLGKFKDLRELYLGGKSFSGNIPPSLYNLSNLQILSLYSNQLEGVLHPHLGFYFPQLDVLEMFENQLSGSIPVSLSNLSKLETLDLGNNNFTGKFLFDGRKTPNLSVLNIRAAIMGGGEVDELDFLNTLVHCTFLKRLIIRDNNLGGNISHSIANLSVHIRVLDLSNNLISGEIPSGLGNLLSLEHLSLTGNQLTGTIPHDIGRLHLLEEALLDNNNLFGEIPSSLGNLPMLSKLNLSHNKFHLLVPATLGNCKNLLKLDLSHNKFVGSIPRELFEAPQLFELYLQENMLQGSLPSEIGESKQLVTVDMSSNNLSGNIPLSLGRCLCLTKLYLDDNFFDGLIPSSFSNLRSLQDIDLSSNRLSGQLPKYFSSFPDLKYVNLSFNDLEGDVPKSGIFANVSAIFLVGNNMLCGGILQLKLPRCGAKKSHAIPIFCCFLVLAIVFFAYLECTKKEKQASSETQHYPLSIQPFIKVSYCMLLKATNGFSAGNMIGSGYFSSVYKGTLLLDGAEKSVAIKVIHNQRQGARQSFLAECEALRVIRHRNIVRVVTACSSIDYQRNDFNAIVYEYMSKGSLERWLYSDPDIEGQLESLNLLQRLNIAIDVAHALDYIQTLCKTPLVHCDLKPSNILLDDDLVAHVGDLGLVKLPSELAKEIPNYISLGIRGTVGYIAPEYGLGAPMSVAGDVYSYGIILLELMIAKKPTDVMFEGGKNLHKFAESALPNHVQEILDPKLQLHNNNEESSHDLNNTKLITKCAFECITVMITIGVQCSSELPRNRMDIKDVIRQLHSQKDKLLLCGRRHRCQIIV